MSIITMSELTRHGVARRATVTVGDETLRFQNLGVWLDPAERLAHLMDAGMRLHLATVPLDTIVVEWDDLSPIRRAAHVR
ncbi:MAG TPA: hypothetical protein VFZ24_16380 [Longimicrobiales bacterium]